MSATWCSSQDAGGCQFCEQHTLADGRPIPHKVLDVRMVGFSFRMCEVCRPVVARWLTLNVVLGGPE